MKRRNPERRDVDREGAGLPEGYNDREWSYWVRSGLV